MRRCDCLSPDDLSLLSALVTHYAMTLRHSRKAVKAPHVAASMECDIAEADMIFSKLSAMRQERTVCDA